MDSRRCLCRLQDLQRGRRGRWWRGQRAADGRRADDRSGCVGWARQRNRGLPPKREARASAHGLILTATWPAFPSSIDCEDYIPQSTLLATTRSPPLNYGQHLRQEESTATTGLCLQLGRTARGPVRQSRSWHARLCRSFSLECRQYFCTHHEPYPYCKRHRAQHSSHGTPQIRPRPAFGLHFLQHPSEFSTNILCRRLLHPLHRVHRVPTQAPHAPERVLFVRQTQSFRGRLRPIQLSDIPTSTLTNVR